MDQQINLCKLNFIVFNSFRNHFWLNIKCILLQISNILLNLKILKFRPCSFKCYRNAVKWSGNSCTCWSEYLHWFHLHKLFDSRNLEDKMERILGIDCSQLHVWGAKLSRHLQMIFWMMNNTHKGNSDTIVSENLRNWKRQGNVLEKEINWSVLVCMLLLASVRVPVRPGKT